MHVAVHDSMDTIPAADWNRLTGDDPFLHHAFLAALEHSGSACAETGWQAQHLTCRDATGRILGAMPLYLKSHSFGEYVFDWAWADAWQRAGGNYYPKLVAAIPFSPVPGARLLIDPSADRLVVGQTLVNASLDLARDLGISSVHCLFPQASELPSWQQQDFLPRLDCQFHWHKPVDCADFEQWLERFTAQKRKKIHRERRCVAEAGIHFRHLSGHELAPALLGHVYDCYAATYLKRGRSPYLSRSFFEEITKTLPGSLLIILAEQAKKPVAAAICFRNQGTLYGRHWGCLTEFDKLHFETCYYQGIEYCLKHGLTTFNPGTQGEHKLARGFEPVTTHSAHWVADSSFHEAVADFLTHETRMMEGYIHDAIQHLPFHKHI